IGLTVAEAAGKTGKTPPELVMEILREDAPGSLGAFGGMSEDNLKRILKQEWVCCGTDETARPADDSLGLSHPRGFGSFPTFIRMLRKEGVPLEQIIRKITSLPAGIFKLSDRGTIRPGKNADLVIFQEDELDSPADFRSPHEPASGIRTVYVNGKAAYDGLLRKVTARAGRIAGAAGPQKIE
ncbi:MAG: amidohydrolase family protein, partial [Lentisphaeria bacterium]|nr:amidohydrolase family protein [Lentisphaeria bacterium]